MCVTKRTIIDFSSVCCCVQQDEKWWKLLIFCQYVVVCSKAKKRGETLVFVSMQWSEKVVFCQYVVMCREYLLSSEPSHSIDPAAAKASSTCAYSNICMNLANSSHQYCHIYILIGIVWMDECALKICCVVACHLKNLEHH